MKRVLILVFSNLKNDSRVTRQVEFLKEKFLLTVVCFESHPIPGVDIIEIERLRLTFSRKALLSFFLISGFYEVANRLLHNYTYLIPRLRDKNFDLIIANDIETMPMAMQISKSGAKVFLDAHEFSPKQFEDRLYWRIFFKRFYTFLCKMYIPLANGMSTINNGLAKEYQKEFGVKPVIITNAADYHNLTPQLRLNYPIRLVHHGIFTVSRQPEIMVDMMNLLDERFTLDLIYLIPESASPQSKEYFEKFSREAQRNKRIRVLPPLKRSEIVQSLNANYDIGIILVPPVNFNYQHGLPNKLYECIQGRLAMAVGPLNEIAQVVTDHCIGIVSKEFTAKSMADELLKINMEDLNAFKSNTNRAASLLSTDHNKKVLIDEIERCLKTV
jgi:hypothetical protein